MGTAGLTGVWAEENTRASLFEAMQRKETFAVSGPHIKVRLFGGWEYTADMLGDRDWVKTGYAKGVPMGGDLPPARAKAPTFLVWAVKDPTSGNLDRIQIVKGWTQSGQSFEKIFDVVWAGDRKPDKWTGVVPPIGSTVDVENATYTNTIGAVELKATWTDPEFDPSLHAFYYARVLEIPTPRWTTIQAKQLGVAPPDVVAATLQERAWSSPIWYTPSAEARKNAKPGITVAELRKKGAVALSDAQLRALIVEKSPWLENTVTGDKYQIIYGALRQERVGQAALPAQPGYVTERFAANQGELQLRYVGRKPAQPSLFGDAAERQLPRRLQALLHQQRQDRHRPRRHADRDLRLQGGRQVRRRAQQRVRVRQLRDRSGGGRAEPLGTDRQESSALRPRAPGGETHDPLDAAGSAGRLLIALASPDV